ncbi:MAG: DMT family transporter [Anaerolineae bacterium]|nr:DMT family transporter [Anaerolineae bacterium]
MNVSPHFKAVLQALFVTFLWSTSWVLIKLGLADIPALTFAGLRYSLAFLCLLPFAWRPAHLATLRKLSGRGWLRLIGLGLLFYSVTQGAQFVGLAYLPAVTVNLLLSFTNIIVPLLGLFFLAESPTRWQWLGGGLSLAGAALYFYPAAVPPGQILGLAVVGIGVLANAGSAVLGRFVNRAGHVSPLIVTLVSMGVGSLALLTAGIVTQGWPALSLSNWVIIGWLALVNTAFAFTLWNLTLRTLSAMESSLINNAMLLQIPFLAWLFLGETITGRELIGLALAGVGILVVQLRGKR